MTYNKYLTEGILNGKIKEKDVSGVRVYVVRSPLSGEEVVGYVNFSGFLAEQTLTGMAGQSDV